MVSTQDLLNRSVSPSIRALIDAWSAHLDLDGRERLIQPLLPRLIGTAATKKAEQRRAFLARDFAVRVAVPAWFDAVKLDSAAALLRSLPEIRTTRASRRAGVLVEAIADALMFSSGDHIVALVARDAAFASLVVDKVAPGYAARAVVGRRDVDATGGIDKRHEVLEKLAPGLTTLVGRMIAAGRS